MQCEYDPPVDKAGRGRGQPGALPAAPPRPCALRATSLALSRTNQRSRSAREKFKRSNGMGLAGSRRVRLTWAPAHRLTKAGDLHNPAFFPLKAGSPERGLADRGDFGGDALRRAALQCTTQHGTELVK